MPKIDLDLFGNLSRLELIDRPAQEAKSLWFDFIRQLNDTSAVPLTINLQRPAFRSIPQLIKKPKIRTSFGKAGSTIRLSHPVVALDSNDRKQNGVSFPVRIRRGDVCRAAKVRPEQN